MTSDLTCPRCAKRRPSTWTYSATKWTKKSLGRAVDEVLGDAHASDAARHLAGCVRAKCLKEPVESTPDLEALGVAVEALDAALARQDDAFFARDLFRTYASAVEATWWICAIDEQLGRRSTNAPEWENPHEEPPFVVDADWFGARAARGLRWVRDCHSHQLPLTTEINVRSYFDPRPGAGQVRSEWVVWRAAHEIPSDPTRGSKAARRAYEQSVAGRNSVEPLAAAAAFLRRQVATLDQPSS